MPADDGTPEEPPFRGPPLPPDDRLWRHPSEHVVPLERAARGRRSVALLGAAAVGAALALAGAWAVGAFDDETPTAEVARERQVTPATTVVLAAPGAGGLDEVAATLVAVRVGDTEGAGIVLRDDGYVLTTADLVVDRPRVSVWALGGPERDAEVVGTDPATDVAVLHVPGLTAEGAVFGAAHELAVGDDARTVRLRTTDRADVLAGVVANLAVTVTRDGSSPLHGLIGTDIVAAEPVEGAALVDAEGTVVGLTTTVGDTDAVRAVPVDLARIVAADLIATGRPAHPWLGIEGRDLDAAVAADWGIPGGAALVSVVADGPADAAGLRADDVVTHLGDTEIATMGDLVTALRHHDPGDTVRLGYLRAGRPHWCEAELAEST